MSKLIICLASFMLFMSCVCGADTQSSLIGTWLDVIDPARPAIKEAVTSFRDDGTFVSHGVFNTPNGELKIDVEGKWTAADGVLTEEIVKSSHPTLANIGSITKDTIVSVSVDSLILRNSKGKEHIKKRKGG
ncbi:hypothetical protein BH11VER1_BH11VER1_22020 [soil metagenome]